MSTDHLLHSFCDVSGSCLIWLNANTGKNRPRCNSATAKLLGVSTIERMSIARVLMFKKWPNVDPNTCVIMTCLHPHCVAWEHVQRGLVNEPMGKKKYNN
jgi:hypothetical protein